MFLKISNGKNNWTLFSDVDRVNFSADKHSVSKRDELDAIAEKIDGLINLVSKDCFPCDNPIDVGILEFYRNGMRIVTLFASVAYVLNDAGDTIEKIHVSNQRRN